MFCTCLTTRFVLKLLFSSTDRKVGCCLTLQQTTSSCFSSGQAGFESRGRGGEEGSSALFSVCWQPVLDLPIGMDLNEGSRRNREKMPDDIFVVVKQYICSVQLAQPPMLVLTSESRATFPLTTSSDKPNLVFSFVFGGQRSHYIRYAYLYIYKFVHSKNIYDIISKSCMTIHP